MMSGILISALAIPATIVILYYGKQIIKALEWMRAYWVLRHLPRPSGPLLGGYGSTIVGPHRHRVVTDLCEKFDGVFYYRNYYDQRVVLTDPILVAEVLQNNRLKKGGNYGPFRKLISPKGLPVDAVSAEGGLHDEVWRLVRKGVAPAFSVQNLRKSFAGMNGVGKRLVNVLKARGAKELDVSNALIALTIDTIGTVGFHHEFGTVETVATMDMSPMLEMIYRATGATERIIQSRDGKTTEFPEEIKKFHSIMLAIADEVHARPENKEDQSIGACLMRIRDKNGAQLSMDILHANVAVFFFAGFDTTGNTMAWALYFLSQHPEVEAKVVAELDSLGLLATSSRLNPRDIEFDDLAKLTYLACVVKESMRMFPVIPLSPIRISDEDLVLGGGRLLVPKNTSIWTPIMPLHRSSRLYDEPDRFFPERWLEPDAEYAPMAKGEESGQASGQAGSSDMAEANAAEGRHGRAKRFIPFSDGRRDCVGQNFARVSYLSTMARLLSHFHFRLADRMGGPEGVLATQRMAVTLQPAKGMWMECVTRVP